MQSFWGRKVITGSSCLLSLKAPLMSHTETAPLVLPLARNCPLLGKDGDSWQAGITPGVEAIHIQGPRSLQRDSDILESGRGCGHLRIQIKVDALIGGHFPTQRPQEVARLPEIPAQKFSILKTRTRVCSQPRSLSPTSTSASHSPSNLLFVYVTNVTHPTCLPYALCSDQYLSGS